MSTYKKLTKAQKKRLIDMLMSVAKTAEGNLLSPVLDKSGQPTGITKFDQAAAKTVIDAVGVILKTYADDIPTCNSSPLGSASPYINLTGMSLSERENFYSILSGGDGADERIGYEESRAE